MIQNEMKNFVKYTSIGLLSSVIFFGFSTPILAQNNTSKTIENHSTILVGAENTANYLSKLKGKKVGLISNQTGIVTINGTTMHTVDLLLKNNINVVKLYSPEHGFRGDADAGAKVKSGVDAKTNLPISSLYGDNKKPQAS